MRDFKILKFSNISFNSELYSHVGRHSQARGALCVGQRYISIICWRRPFQSLPVGSPTLYYTHND